MGYGFGYSNSGRMALSCDSCGKVGGVRKRKCPYKVSHDGYQLPYCPAPALCSDCYKSHGGLRGVHGDACKQGAAASQAEEDAKQAKLAAGDMQPVSAWGDWQEGVPAGMVGVLYRGLNDAAYYLLPKEAYESRPWFSEVGDFAETWENNPDVMSKRIA
jgi:hypothetical protein